MKLEDFGYNEMLEGFRIEHNLSGFEVGRVITEHKERFIVKTNQGEFDAEVSGKMRFFAENREDFPAVGDWVALTVYHDGFSIIHEIFPRKTIIERQAVGKFGEKQIIATNIDCAFITQSVDRDFNINRMERYMAICYSANVEPIIVLSKTDLVDKTELELLIGEIKSRIKNIDIITITNQDQKGYEKLRSILGHGKTYCFLGSSGVGKSTIINYLIGKEVLKTSSISASTNKGRHTTSHREMVFLENGSILIDNPGMREVGIADTQHGIEKAFDAIVQLTQNCRFSDCSHIHEKGCAVIEALENGLIDKHSYDNYLKLEREKQYFQTTIAEKRKKEKAFGKMQKSSMAIIKKRKF